MRFSLAKVKEIRYRCGMSAKWEQVARGEIMMGQIDPNYVPRYRVPARRWWQFWKPKWRWINGVSRAQIARAHGLDPQTVWDWQFDQRPIGLKEMFGIDLRF